MRKIRREDEVIVISGRDRGRVGEVVQVMPDGRLLVAGVNMVRKHVRANPQANEQGGIVSREAPIQASNVAIYNRDTSKADRVGIRVEDGKRVRFFKSSGALIDD
ncbi:MAG: 50S ribosomal protein L24 [Gammaproteobacteria bacterium]|nr:50S ribosomal protein L24 [Gammaproteobacteria bacterium]MDE0226827.1 50S ribosomal protein L24 [Gammaproteobacteria bacterium]MDE0450563.1 50S ribosomal protein L24 [Gammaproteobacteria bacterium]